MKIVDS